MLDYCAAIPMVQSSILTLIQIWSIYFYFSNQANPNVQSLKFPFFLNINILDGLRLQKKFSELGILFAFDYSQNIHQFSQFIGMENRFLGITIDSRCSTEEAIEKLFRNVSFSEAVIS